MTERQYCYSLRLLKPMKIFGHAVPEGCYMLWRGYPEMALGWIKHGYCQRVAAREITDSEGIFVGMGDAILAGHDLSYRLAGKHDAHVCAWHFHLAKRRQAVTTAIATSEKEEAAKPPSNKDIWLQWRKYRGLDAPLEGDQHLHHVLDCDDDDEDWRPLFLRPIRVPAIDAEELVAAERGYIGLIFPTAISGPGHEIKLAEESNAYVFADDESREKTKVTDSLLKTWRRSERYKWAAK